MKAVSTAFLILPAQAMALDEFPKLSANVRIR
jgi:hypothetical protein